MFTQLCTALLKDSRELIISLKFIDYKKTHSMIWKKIAYNNIFFEKILSCLLEKQYPNINSYLSLKSNNI